MKEDCFLRQFGEPVVLGRGWGAAGGVVGGKDLQKSIINLKVCFITNMTHTEYFHTNQIHKMHANHHATGL